MREAFFFDQMEVRHLRHPKDKLKDKVRYFEVLLQIILNCFLIFRLWIYNRHLCAGFFPPSLLGLF
jgi:hypothetical protein